MEKMCEYKGLYYVFYGLILLMDGIGFEDINIFVLVECFKNDEVKEFILVMNFNLEGEFIVMYIFRLVKLIGIKVIRLV